MPDRVVFQQFYFTSYLVSSLKGGREQNLIWTLPPSLLYIEILAKQPKKWVNYVFKKNTDKIIKQLNQCFRKFNDNKFKKKQI